MIEFISGLLGSVIRVIYNLAGNNYLVGLLGFTLLTKIVLFPLVLKQLQSTSAIQKVSPEDKKLREKYKDNPQKLSEEITKLYKENKVNPLAGCLIPLIQIPIMLAMFWVVKQPLTYVEKMDKETITTYTQRYLEKEEVTDNEIKSYEINIAKEYDLINMNVISNVSLGDSPKDVFSKDETKRVSKLTLIVPVLTLIFSIISNKVTQKNSQMSEEQAEMQKSMNLMMPFLSAYISFAWPLALGVYWLFGSILGIVQQLAINKLMNNDKDIDKKDSTLFLGKGEK